jgi:hypothetical protein
MLPNDIMIKAILGDIYITHNSGKHRILENDRYRIITSQNKSTVRDKITNICYRTLSIAYKNIITYK